MLCCAGDKVGAYANARRAAMLFRKQQRAAEIPDGV